MAPSPHYDILVAGAGPAGLTAGIYARRAGKNVLILEKDTFGGQITHSPKVENYPGFSAVSGNELADRLMDQVLALGAEIDVDSVTGITEEPPGENGLSQKTIHTESGREFTASAVIIASGSKPRRLGLPNENTLTGNGVSYCVLCDGAFFKGRPVAVIGGGNSALQDAVLLAETCPRVTVIQNLAFLTGEMKLQETLRSRKNVDFIFNSVVAGLKGADSLQSILLRNTKTGEETSFPVDGIFVAIGQMPENEPFRSVCDLDESGYILADESCTTCTPGVFAAGDCRTKSVRQITTATGDGAAAALAACRYLS